jgi:hypothetical protein
MSERNARSRESVVGACARAEANASINADRSYLTPLLEDAAA